MKAIVRRLGFPNGGRLDRDVDMAVDVVAVGVLTVGMVAALPVIFAADVVIRVVEIVREISK